MEMRAGGDGMVSDSTSMSEVTPDETGGSSFIADWEKKIVRVKLNTGKEEGEVNAGAEEDYRKDGEIERRRW